MDINPGDAAARAALPTAASLICAVHDQDADTIQRQLLELDVWELRALAVVLAAHVPDDTPLTLDLAALDPVRLTIEATAARFRVSPDDICSASRARDVTAARAVAMTASRMLGLSSSRVGERFDRDHSTVLNAQGRVQADPRLRSAATAIAERVRRLVGSDEAYDDGAHLTEDDAA